MIRITTNHHLFTLISDFFWPVSPSAQPAMVLHSTVSLLLYRSAK